MTTIDPTPAQVLACPLEANDIDAVTVGGWLVAHLRELWHEGHHRLRDDGPVVKALIRAGYAEGEIDGDGYLAGYDDERIDRLVTEAIASLYPAAAAEVPRPEIVVLCGSTRFGDAFRAANLRLTLEGRIVLSIGCDTKSDDDLAAAFAAHGDGLKGLLDELHLRKVDLADWVLVLDCEVDGRPYVGESTAREIAYAQAHGKPVRYLSEHAGVA